MLRQIRILVPVVIAIVSCGKSLQAAGAFLIFSPTSITVTGNSGGPVVTQTVALQNNGSGPTDWAIGVDPTAPWLTASPASGKGLAAGTSVTITVTANPATLKLNSIPGYQANMTAQGIGTSATLGVTFKVTGTTISVVPNPISLSVLEGTQQIFANVAQINGSANVSITVTSGAWLTADSSALTPAPFSIVINAKNLTASPTPYQGSLLIQCINAVPCIAQTVPVNLTVYSQVTLNCLPVAGPTQVGLAYSTTCTATGGSNSYLWSIGAGSLPAGVSLSTFTGNTIQVSGTPTTVGPYSYTIRATENGIRAQYASQSFSGTINPAAPSTLSASPSSVSFGSYTLGGTVPAAQSIGLTSSSPASGLAFTSSLGSDCAWLSLSPPGGSTPAILVASVNPDGATSGNHSCVITFNASGISPTPTVTATVAIGSGNRPVISAVVNAASFNGGPITTGSWITLFGSNLAPAGDSRQWNASTEIVNGAFPTSLDGTSVMINGKPASVEFISPNQVNVQPPDDTAAGPVPVVISTAAVGASAPFTVNYAQFAPGLFMATTPYLAAQHVDGSYIGGYAGATPAKPGEVITLWGTGFGPSTPQVPSGQIFVGASKLANDVTVTIGGQNAQVDFAGVVAAGLVQINVHVPTSINDGDAAVLATVGGVSTQASGNLIAIHN